MATSSGPKTKTMSLTPAEECELLSKINEDVIHFMKDFLYEYGQIFGSRVYDEAKTCEKARVCDKIMMGLFGPWNDYNPEPVAFPEPATPFTNNNDKRKAEEEHYKQEADRIKKEKKQRGIDNENHKKAEEILDKILKERHEGLNNLYMNFVLVLYVKANRKSTTESVGAVKMFRFAKRNEHDKPSDNFFIGGDLRLYNNWADFVAENQIPHDCLVLAPSAGQFLYTDGMLHLDIFHVTRYIRTFVEPVLAGVGLVGTGMLCASLPPVGIAVGIGASGVGAISGITRGILELFDRGSHHTLMRTSSIIPTIDILSNVLFAHSAVGALRLTKFSNSFLNTEKFLSCILFTENAFRIGAVSRLSLDILSTIIAFGCGKLDLATMSQRLLSSCIFLYNVGLDFNLADYTRNLSTVVCAVPTCLTYENVQPFIRMAQDYFGELPGFHLVENLQEFTGLFSIVLHNLRNSNRCSFGNLTTTLKRLMNVKWKLIAGDLKRCKEWVNEHFTEDELTSNFKSIQMAIVYNLHETLKKFVQVDDENIDHVEYNINLLMTDVINLWKRMFTIIYPDQNPDIRHCTMIMRYLLCKIDRLLRYNVDIKPGGSTAFSEVQLPGARPKLLPMAEVFTKVMNQLVKEDIIEMSTECKEMISGKDLEPIQHVIQHRYASVSFIQQTSTNDASEEVYEDNNGNPSAFCKVDPLTKLGVLIKSVELTEYKQHFLRTIFAERFLNNSDALKFLEKSKQDGRTE